VPREILVLVPRLTIPGLIALVFLMAGCLLDSPASAQWVDHAVATKARLRGLGVVGDNVVWASGTGGTVLRTADGGRTWNVGSVQGASALDFRDVQAVDGGTAYLLSIGPGEQSRIFKTADAGATWATLYTNTDPKGFLDALAFSDADRGLALGDPVDGRFVVLATDDGGRTWKPANVEGMPPALPGEGAFAASGTCLVVGRNGHAWFGTGGAKTARVFGTVDGGRTWEAHETPLMAGTPSSGIFSLAFRDDFRGVAVGGDYKEPGQARNAVALTEDGGRTWRTPKGRGPSGYRSAVAYVPGRGGTTLVAVGPTGSDISTDGGENWTSLGPAGFHAVGFASPSVGWAVGEDGRVARWAGWPVKDR
jgi:photosystem II stability/assembly factor-like uncharacterized protein